MEQEKPRYAGTARPSAPSRGRLSSPAPPDRLPLPRRPSPLSRPPISSADDPRLQPAKSSQSARSMPRSQLAPYGPSPSTRTSGSLRTQLRAGKPILKSVLSCASAQSASKFRSGSSAVKRACPRKAYSKKQSKAATRKNPDINNSSSTSRYVSPRLVSDRMIAWIEAPTPEFFEREKQLRQKAREKAMMASADVIVVLALEGVV